jgi:transcriptional regulator with XRE-family HTH domain
VKTIATKRHKRLIKLLTDERKTRKLRQEGVAHALRKPQAWVSIIERGDRRLDVVEYLSLAEAIGFDPHAVLSQIQAVPLDKPLRAVPEPKPRKARPRKGHRR